MTKLLCLNDAYLKTCTAKVASIQGNQVELDQTVFYPTGGGVPCDKGVLKKGEAVFSVTDVKKDRETGKVWHTLENVAGLSAGDALASEIDWDFRHKIIRMHTATHILGSVMYGRGFAITGNQIGFDQTRVDFNCETGVEKEAMEAGVAAANDELKKDVALKIYSLPRDKAFRIPGIVKLANALPPSVTELRIVEIPGIDIQADGGCHVKNVNEIGQINLDRIENKGAKNKRVYFSLTPQS
ncbi:MAG: alanyl-tRNA editing protein [Candidatus Micrarchaeota archaeon]|nr:alanyl-tRNA editing protein [Candidatus Micrarchaeota archaeon]